MPGGDSWPAGFGIGSSSWVLFMGLKRQAARQPVGIPVSFRGSVTNQARMPCGRLVTQPAKVHTDEMQQLTCNCGAIYEVIENEVPLEGPDSDIPKCASCGRELRWIGPHPQFHLVKHPEQDRE